ncbi:protoporphyrinogen oxidase HemJ [Solimonas sp. K1W22B-7]|uniref:protoporphyrinogen oxidase HemJ n=1 Tax=Solimonas sp. K1W22B-7 TaxID=2303331 RepID=UPI000E336B4B|nr:protoporphyrinogen oxidase HemJ [Solimonas sp. K1W22B-7]AXQ27437.1 protoporphyrinogen oxidase HemJ [Solimonas sp. K1W22B-7]
MLWLKAFHIIFVVCWFAGLFYLPRLFVYHTEVKDPDGHQRFCLMEKRLMTMTTIGMLGTWILGLWLLSEFPGYMKAGWFHAKLTLVLALSGYHGWLKTRVRAFAAQSNTKSAKFYRIMNEVPALALVAIVVLVVVKPF